MTFGRYKSVRRVLKTTLLLAGLSLVLSPELLAEECAGTRISKFGRTRSRSGR